MVIAIDLSKVEWTISTSPVSIRGANLDDLVKGALREAISNGDMCSLATGDTLVLATMGHDGASLYEATIRRRGLLPSEDIPKTSQKIVKSRIVQDPDLLGGRPHFWGTLTVVETILQLFQEGFDVERILRAHPELLQGDIWEALEYAIQSIKKVGK